MKQPSFLARRTFGAPNYFLIAMAVAFLAAFIPRGVRKAVESNTNKAEDWLPSSYEESIDLRWFREHFVDGQFALISWKGNTLGDNEKLYALARKLVPDETAIEKAGADSDIARNARWYTRVETGPQALEQLTQHPLSLSYGEAIKRFEGALVGPLARDELGEPLKGEDGEPLGNDSRVTCLIVYLSEEATKDNKTMRAAIENIVHIATTQCAIAEPDIHMGGPPVDNITIDIEGERTLVRLASLSGIVGLALSYWCFRSMKLTAIVFAVGVMSAGMSLAIVFYFGIVEVVASSLESPRLGTVDAILMSMPAVVYVLGLSGSIHIVNYYRDARREDGLHNAAETAVSHGVGPCVLAAFTTAVGLGSLYTSDILPIAKFGMFTAIAVLATVGVLFTVLPVFLHRFPVSKAVIDRGRKGSESHNLPAWAEGLFGWVIRNNALACVLWAFIMCGVGYGITKIGTSVQLLKLLDEDADLIHDYAWLEENLGNLVPMEVVLTVPPERMRDATEHAEEDGLQYRDTMLEMLTTVRTIQERIESLPEISRTLSAATFAPENTDSGYTTADRSGDFAKNKSLEENRELLTEAGYLRLETSGDDEPRELWRISARVAALSEDSGGVDYGQFVEELKHAVDPVLVAHAQRDQVVKALNAKSKQINGATLAILFRAPENQGVPNEDSQERVLANLLEQSGIKGDVGFVNLTKFDAIANDPSKTEQIDRIIETLSERDGLVIVSVPSDPSAKMLARGGNVVDVSDVPIIESTAAKELAVSDQPRPIRAVYTGMVPLVYKTQRQLLISLRESIMWATVLIAVVMVFVLKSPMAGLISMVPNVFPIVIVFGLLGWMGIKVDIGIMMTASVALGVAVDDTVHFLTWFRRGVKQGLNRVEATMLAYDRCATAMTQTTIIGGLGLAVFATSTFTPTQQFGYLMITMLGAALIGDLLLLPALLAGPLGYFFGGSAPDEGQDSGRHTASEDFAAVDSKVHHIPEEDPAESQPGSTAAAVAAQAPEPPLIDHESISEGPHATLHAKLRSLRRDPSRGSVSS
ncbi:MAG: MMPL family transporter [Planctomycetota bacterium]